PSFTISSKRRPDGKSPSRQVWRNSCRCRARKRRSRRIFRRCASRCRSRDARVPGTGPVLGLADRCCDGRHRRGGLGLHPLPPLARPARHRGCDRERRVRDAEKCAAAERQRRTDRKSTRLNSSHVKISYAVFCLKKKKKKDRESKLYAA